MKITMISYHIHSPDGGAAFGPNRCPDDSTAHERQGTKTSVCLSDGKAASGVI